MKRQVNRWLSIRCFGYFIVAGTPSWYSFKLYRSYKKYGAMSFKFCETIDYSFKFYRFNLWFLIKRKNIWVDDLIRCPSQCYYYINYKGKAYTLYLRWRHDDPWSFGVISHDTDEWSGCLFEKNSLYFKEDDLKKAKRKAVKLGKEYIRE